MFIVLVEPEFLIGDIKELETIVFFDLVNHSIKEYMDKYHDQFFQGISSFVKILNRKNLSFLNEQQNADFSHGKYYY